ncbi:MAG: Ig-like domain-containing protein, partial [Clostridia bacterium]|nr:Ig-like domain-containing protein [Clostridia bacterium]
MGMFIMPWSYIAENDELTTTDYASVETKLDYTFYSSDGSVNKVYEYEDKNGDTYYRVNGVISNLKLKNYAREFVGVGYIKETKNGVTKYEYTDINYADNVRSAAYVAIEAHADPDYAEIDNAKRTFEKYVDGAQLVDKWGVTATEDGKYTYNGVDYNSLAEVKAQIANYDYSLTMGTVKYVKEGGTAQLGAITDTTNKVDFDGAHAVYTSSDESIVKVDKYGTLTWVKNGTATITATFMGETKTCDVISGVIDFEDGLPSYVKEGGRATVSVKNGELNAKAQATSNGENNNNNARVTLDVNVMGAMFEDPDIAYLAFDLKLPTDFDKTTAGNGVTRIYYQDYAAAGKEGQQVWTLYCDYSYNGNYETAPIGYYQTYYFPRAAYQSYVDYNHISDGGRFINVGSGILESSEGFYIDNIRAVTAEEKTAERNWYSFEYGGIRKDGAVIYLYDHEETSQWQLQFSGLDASTAKYTSENVTDGVTALTFKKKAGNTQMVLNHNLESVKEKEMRNAGYIA